MLGKASLAINCGFINALWFVVVLRVHATSSHTVGFGTHGWNAGSEFCPPPALLPFPFYLPFLVFPISIASYLVTSLVLLGFLLQGLLWVLV